MCNFFYNKHNFVIIKSKYNARKPIMVAHKAFEQRKILVSLQEIPNELNNTNLHNGYNIGTLFGHVHQITPGPD